MKSWRKEISLAEQDVVVVGSGIAGLAAAIEAANRNCKVTVLEKRRILGGNTRLSAGEYSAYTDPLRLADKLGLPEDTPELHQDDMLRAGDYAGNPKLVEVVAKEAPKGLAWLLNLGVALEEVLTKPGGHSSYRCHRIAGGGKEIIKALAKAANQRGVRILLEHKMIGLLKEKGRILAVRATRGNENLLFVAKKAVVLATGGFAADVEMRMQHNYALGPEVKTTNHRQATGEAIRIAKSVGADTTHMDYIQLYPFAEPKTGLLDRAAVIPFAAPAFGLIYVTNDGRRFVNELDRRDRCARAQLALTTKPTFSLASAKIIQQAGFTLEQVERDVARGRIFKAPSIWELAQIIGAPPATLQLTVENHNAYVRQRHDPDFHKPIDERMLPLDEPPYYAIPQWPAVHYCMGGLRINEKAQVIDIWGQVIPGLYACGEVTGGIHGTNRLGSCALPECLVFGRIAGAMAAQEDPLNS